MSLFVEGRKGRRWVSKVRIVGFLVGIVRFISVCGVCVDERIVRV